MHSLCDSYRIGYLGRQPDIADPAYQAAFVPSIQSTPIMYHGMLLTVLPDAAGSSPTVHILAQFYPKSHHAKVFSLISTASATIGYIIAAPLAAGLMSIKGSGSMAGWQWLFIIEGVPSVLLGVAIMLWLPNEPLTAWMLHLEERQLLHDEVRQKAATSSECRCKLGLASIISIGNGLCSTA